MFENCGNIEMKKRSFFCQEIKKKAQKTKKEKKKK